jgi:3-oxoacyl-[acyl-carrier protein] reductase
VKPDVLARELGPRGIRVNALNPGLIETEGAHAAGVIGPEMEANAIKQTPLGRGGKVGDVARIAAFLASDDSGWPTGEQLLACRCSAPPQSTCRRGSGTCT